MPHVIWLSRLISEDQCLCPLTEPTNTKPSLYAMSAWVPSCDQVKSLTWKIEMFHLKILVYTGRCHQNYPKNAFLAVLPTGKYYSAAQVLCQFLKDSRKNVYLGSPVIHQLYWPSSFILDPYKNTSFHIAGGQLLKGFIPAHQDNLQKPKETGLFNTNTSGFGIAMGMKSSDRKSISKSAFRMYFIRHFTKTAKQ